MSSSRLWVSHLAALPIRCRFPRVFLRLLSNGLISNSTHTPSSCSSGQSSELFNYTSGRWIYNDTAQHASRRRFFNIHELKRLAASSVGRSVGEVISFKKLGEGGFNRAFLITFHDGFQLVARIPYRSTEPKHLIVANEVATLDFLRSNNLPVPEVYGYSNTAENPAETEYIFMELVRGTKLGDVWYDLPAKARITVVTRLVQLESQLLNIPLPASGSLYYTTDLDTEASKVDITTSNTLRRSGLCVGPDARLHLWYGRRSKLNIDRGPLTNASAVLTAGAKKEIAYLREFGRPLYPSNRLYRESYGYKKVCPSEHLRNLERYLQIASHMLPKDDALTRPILRHPDLNLNNVFIADDLSITGLIDWQYCAILPLFLHCGIPRVFQNYGDNVSETLTKPELPPDFDAMTEEQQFVQVMLLRKRQLHYHYVSATEKYNPSHYDALSQDFSALRRSIFDHASSPWEGDNIGLKSDLVKVQQNWLGITASRKSENEDVAPVCPIDYTEEETQECLRLQTAQLEADDMLRSCNEILGVGPEGWVPVDQYDEAKLREAMLKKDALEAAETEYERRALLEHWIFDDFDEREYL